jgi:hypothetical protein
MNITPEDAKAIIERVANWPLDLRITAVVSLCWADRSVRQNPALHQFVRDNADHASVIVALMPFDARA